MARPRKFDPDELLEGAVEVFWEKGFEGASVCDLEEALGVGRQSLYNTFGDKRGLFLAALDRFAQRSDENLRRLREGPGGVDAIRTYFHDLVRFLLVDARGRSCLLTRSLVEEGQDDPEISTRCQANTDRIQAAFTAALTRAVEAGEVDPGIPIRDAAGAMAAQVYGLGVLAAGSATIAGLDAQVEVLLDRLTRP